MGGSRVIAMIYILGMGEMAKRIGIGDIPLHIIIIITLIGKGEAMFRSPKRRYYIPKKKPLFSREKEGVGRQTKKLRSKYRNHEAVDEFIDQTKYELFL